MKYCCFLKSKDVLRGEVKRGRRLDCWPFMQFANSIVGWTHCSIELSCSHIDQSKTQVAFTTKTKHETIVDVHNALWAKLLRKWEIEKFNKITS